MKTFKYKLGLLILFTIGFKSFSQNKTAKKIEDAKEASCHFTNNEKPEVAIFPLDVSAPSVKNAIGREISQRITAYHKGSKCYNLSFVPSHYIPKNAQAYISGNLKDIYTSEKAIGKPRLHFDLELRDAKTQKVLVSTTINLKGKLYLGYGNNKPFKTIFQQSLDLSKQFLIENRHLIPKKQIEVVAKNENKSAYEQALENAPGAQKRTESTWEKMKNHSNKKRAEARNRYLGKVEYHNDKTAYKSLSKTKGDQYIILKINGKIYESNKQKGLFTTSNSRSYLNDEIDLYMQDVMKSRTNTLKMYDPVRQPATRDFTLGTTNGVLNEEANENFKMKGRFSMGGGKAVEVDYWVYKGEVKRSNINKGNVKILYYEPQRGGIIDFEFSLQVKNPKTKKSDNIEGRIRARMI